jgi:hypothetical protein
MNGSEVPYHTALETFSSNWQWTRVNIGTSTGTATDEPRVFNLSAGTHTLIFRGREANSALDQFIICNDLDFVPGVNTAPTVGSIPDQTVAEDTSTGNLPLTIGDAESNPANLTLSATSSNPTLVPQGNIAFGGSGSNRTVRVIPAANQFGTAAITVWVSDGALSGSRTFQLTVTNVNDAPTMGPLANATVRVKTSALSPVVIADIDSPATSLVVTGRSSDTRVLPNGNIFIGSSGLSRTLSVRPQRTGITTVTLTVSDGFAQSERSFLLTVKRWFSVQPSNGAASGGSGFTISWESLPGDVYRVMANHDLTLTNWVDVSGALTAVGETTSWTDPTAAGRNACIYMIEFVPPE